MRRISEMQVPSKSCICPPIMRRVFCLGNGVRMAKRNPVHPSAEELDAFYAAVGRAIARWSIVEDQLYTVFEHLVEPNRVGVMMAAFHSLQHTQSKIGMVDAGVIPFGEKYPELVSEWKGLKRRCTKLLGRRNEFAHFQPYYYPRGLAGRMIWYCGR